MELIFIMLFLALFGITFGFFLPGALLLGKIQAVVRTWQIRRKIANNTSIIVEYEPPADLQPVELGYLFDNKFNDREFIATILELGTTGHLMLELKDSRLHYTKITKASEGLTPYQQLLLRQMSNAPASRVIQKQASINLQNTLLSFEVKRSLASKGYFKNTKFNIHRIKLAAIASVLLGLIFAILLAYITMQPTSKSGINYELNGETVDSFPVYIAIIYGMVFGFMVSIFTMPQFLIVIAVYNRMLGFSSDATPALKHVWTSILGYKIYLETVERDNLLYEVQTESSIKNPTLAAGVALGLIPTDLFLRPN